MTEDEWKALDKKMRLWEEWRQKKDEERRLKEPADDRRLPAPGQG